MKSVLITGGAGFVGSTIADRLLNRGDFVVVIDNRVDGMFVNMLNIEVVLPIIGEVGNTSVGFGRGITIVID